MKHKKLLIISASAIVATFAVYTSAWFFAKHKIESYFKAVIFELKNQEKVNSTSYSLTTSCFPFLCVELKNVRLETKKYFSTSKKGFVFEALKENPITYKTKNIFNTNFNFKQQNAIYDIYSTNLDNKQTVKATINFGNLELTGNKKYKEVKISGLSVLAETDIVPMFAVLDVEGFNFKKEITKAGNLHNVAIKYDLSNATSFDKTTGKEALTINHSLGDIVINNLDLQVLDKAKVANAQSKIKLAEEVIKNIHDNKTELLINDFKGTAGNGQFMLKGKLGVDDAYFIELALDTLVKFGTENTMPEAFLKQYQFKINENGYYNIAVRTINNVIHVNNHIKVPAPNLRPNK